MLICTNKCYDEKSNQTRTTIIKITRLSSGENPVKLDSLCDKFQDALTSSTS